MVIYEPKGRAREYAALACNIYRGCDHGCTYCYAPSATYKSPDDFHQPTERKQFLSKLRINAAALHSQGTTGQVLLSFTCDPYQWLDVYSQHTRGTIQILHENGFSVCVLTKGAFRALRDLDLFGPSDAFATTMTLLDPKASHEWEPRAAEPQARMHVIRRFHAAGIPTWVSLEPVLDPEVSLEIIRQTYSYVDLFKVGKLNHHKLSKTIDWHKFGHDAIQLLTSLSYQPIEADDAPTITEKSYYIKADLARFL